MCKVCTRRWNFLLHADEEKGKKKGIEEVSATSSTILPFNVRGRNNILKTRERWYDNIVLNIPQVRTNCFIDYIFIPDKREGIKTITADDSRINKLKKLLNEHSLLINCNSFPSDINDVDLCIGYNKDWSQPSDFVIELVAKFFNGHGYKVGINLPFSNAIAPIIDFTYSSFLIDVNKRVYMNEDTLKLNYNAEKLRDQLAQFYSILLRYR